MDRDNFVEDLIYRNLEPALAFQLEINRLTNYNLEAIPTAALKMHLYLVKAKVPRGQSVTDFRLFISAMVQHSDLSTKESSYKPMENEGQRILFEAMGGLEVAFTHSFAEKIDCNHIFLNFFAKNYRRSFENSWVLRNWLRLCTSRVLHIEVKLFNHQARVRIAYLCAYSLLTIVDIRSTFISTKRPEIQIWVLQVLKLGRELSTVHYIGT